MIITKSAAGSASWIHGCFDYVLVIKKLTKQNHYEYIDVPIQKYIKDCKDGFFLLWPPVWCKLLLEIEKTFKHLFFTESLFFIHFPKYFFSC